MFALLKAVEFALTPHGRLKVGEMKPGSIKSPASNKYIANFTKTQSISRSLSALYIGFLDACELLSSMRGVGWDYGTGNDIYIPLEHRSSEKTGFLKSTLWSTLGYYLLLDMIDTGFKLVPGVSSPSGGSIFRPELSLIPRLVVSTGLHFATGVAFIAGFNMFYGLLTLIAVSWWQPPSAWPPVTENPWATTSLHDFWGKRWHQLLRQAFFVGGGYPLAFLGKTIFGVLFGERVGRTAALWGLLLGTFTASGLFHMFAMYAMGQGIEWKVVGFFSAQAIALILERAWRTATGRRVEGWWGRAWSYLWIVGGGQWCVDAWHRRGLGGGMVIPPSLSVTRLIILPLVLKSKANSNILVMREDDITVLNSSGDSWKLSNLAAPASVEAGHIHAIQAAREPHLFIKCTAGSILQSAKRQVNPRDPVTAEAPPKLRTYQRKEPRRK
ncbi:Membrane bound O-acyl transferase family [Rhizoctonia solani]|nr:Membrane bound O-acyl transferase family [Rhizoctonia solani]